MAHFGHGVALHTGARMQEYRVRRALPAADAGFHDLAGHNAGRATPRRTRAAKASGRDFARVRHRPAPECHRRAEALAPVMTDIYDDKMGCVAARRAQKRASMANTRFDSY